GADRALAVEKRRVKRLVQLLLRAGKERHEAGKLHRLRHWQARHLAGGGEEALHVEKRVVALALRNARSRHEEGHAQRMVVKVLLAQQPVLTDGQALVRGENDDGVRGLAAGLEGLED